MREELNWQRERDWFVGDLVVATVVATWTWWVDLKVAAQSRSGSLTRWSDLGGGCSHGGQIGLGVGCLWRSNWLRGGSFTRSRTHSASIYFPMAPALSVLHCKCSPLFSSAQRGTRRHCSSECGVDLGLASECGVELCLSLVGAWGGALPHPKKYIYIWFSQWCR